MAKISTGADIEHLSVSKISTIRWTEDCQAVNFCEYIRQPFAGKSAGICPEPREFLWDVFVEKKNFFPTKEKTSELTEKHFFPQIFLSILSKKK